MHLCEYQAPITPWPRRHMFSTHATHGILTTKPRSTRGGRMRSETVQMASLLRWMGELSWSGLTRNDKGYLQRQREQHEELCHVISRLEGYLKTIEASSKTKVLNKNQCICLFDKLIQSMKGIGTMLAIATENLHLNFVFEEICSIQEKVEMVMKSCVEHDQQSHAIVFQLQNKETFRELLLDLENCYGIAHRMFLVHHRSKSHEIAHIGFNACTFDKVLDDVRAIKERLEMALQREGVLEEVEFAQHLLLRLRNLDRVAGGDLDALEVPFGFKKPTFDPDLDEIGCGSYGQVYKSNWMGLPCATKVLEGDANVLANSQKEIGILAGLSHPNLIQLFGCGIGKKCGVQGSHEIYMVMELMNMSLSNMLKKAEEPLPYHVAIEIMHQIAKGVHYLHDMQVAHLDLKPDNILCGPMTTKNFDPCRTFKVTDYGTSFLEVCSKPKDQQPTMYTIGTTRYRAPEMNERSSTSLHPFQADVWSFAMTCSEILSREEPYSKLMPTYILNGLISATGGELRPNLPNNCEELTDLIQECWAQDPLQRPSFSMICERLARLKEKFLMGTYPYNSIPKYDTMKRKRDSKKINSHVAKENESMPNHDEVVLDIEQKLTKAKGLLKMKYVGIIGMGGIGKTTLAKAIFDAEMANPSYDALSYIVECKNHESSYDILCKILSQLRDGDMPKDLLGAQRMMKELYEKKKVLLILDDVKDEDQVEEIAPQHVVQGNKGTTIILTTRDKQTMKPYVKNMAMMEVSILDEDSAMNLFNVHCFGNQVRCLSKEFDDLRERVVKACNGLPLSLKVMGAFLHGKTKLRNWEHALQRMERGKSMDGDEEVWNTLKVSFDGLGNNLQKKMFLDMACFFCKDVYSKRLSKDEALHMWSRNNIRPICELERLIDLSMLRLDVSNKYLEMHDQLRDMGRRIAKGTRIWKGSMIFDSGLSSKVVERLEGISWRGPLCQVESLTADESFDPRNLRILIMESDGCNSHETRHNLKLLYSLATKCQGLKCLKIMKLALGLLDERMWNLVSLTTLDLFGCHSLVALPEALGNLTSLMTLNLSWCKSLATLPEKVGNLSSLSSLNLCQCICLATLPEGVGNLTSLTILDLSGCSNLAMLPEGVRNLASLIRLHLSECSKLATLPEGVGNLTSLTTLDLSRCSNLATLPEGLGNLTSLTYLDLHRCSNLAMLPEGVGNLTSLTYLDLSGCSNLAMLPERVGNLTFLTTLGLYGCSNLAMLPEGVGNLTSLTTLDLSGCSNLATLPKGVGNLTSLTTLNLSYCSNLATLPEGVRNLTSLTTLDLSECSNLATLPKGVGNLTSLTYLDLSQCSNLATLPEEVGNLTSLTTLYLYQCSNLAMLPKGVGNLTSLTTLGLQKCSNLATLPEGVGNLTSLTTLNLSGCSNLATLPAGVGNLTSLTTLDLYGCSNLATLPKGVGNLTSLTTLRLLGGLNLATLLEGVENLISLTTLNLYECSNLATLPEGVWNLTSLTTLSLSYYSNLATLPEAVWNLASLTRLYLIGCSNLATLPEGVKNLTSLTTLNLSGCLNLATLPEGVGNLTSLTTLNLSGCLNLATLPEGVGNLTSLTTLGLYGCSNLTTLPEGVGNLTSLIGLHLSGCSNLATLPEGVGNLTSLTTLDLSRCSNLVILPEGVRNLASLTRLHLFGCSKLATLPEGVGNLTSLTTLDLSRCSNLVTLPEGVWNLASLTRLHLSGCSNLATLPKGVLNLAP